MDHEQDPFEAEQRRRAEALASDELDRQAAIAAEAAQQDHQALKRMFGDALTVTRDAFGRPEYSIDHDRVIADRENFQRELRERVADANNATRPPELDPQHIRVDDFVAAEERDHKQAKAWDEYRKQHLDSSARASFAFGEARAKDMAMESARLRQEWCDCDDKDCGAEHDEDRPSEAEQRAEREKLRKQAHRNDSNPVGPHAPGIGGWKPGQHKPETHEALRFEIEAERALFLGKPAPKDDFLKPMHAELARLHGTYQKTGDRSLLLPIAELTAEYTAHEAAHKATGDAERAKQQEPKADHREVQHDVQCVYKYGTGSCSRHGWPVGRVQWSEHQWLKQGILRSKVEGHERDCRAVFPVGVCLAHEWPVTEIQWSVHRADLERRLKGGEGKRQLRRARINDHDKRCVQTYRAASNCLDHGWPRDRLGWAPVRAALWKKLEEEES